MERPTSGPKSLYPKGPSFTLDTFSSKDFIVRDFVDSLAESAVPSHRRSGPAQAAFDSKPLIRAFESICKSPRLLPRACSPAPAPGCHVGAID